MRRIVILAIGMMLISKSFSFTMRGLNRSRCINFQLNSSLPSDPSNFAMPFSLTQASVERELNRALEYARLMDKQHGICTEPSRNAWSIVDAIYEKMQAIRTEHAAQPSTRSNQEQSSRQESRRTQLNESIQNQALYFF
mmetsp:Transcript_22074/g.33419  ORF Transcript_22074/g.33419 Transcript_22074/m.33419 type:complete len:139 (+) Transcript_22074:203-619(+)